MGAPTTIVVRGAGGALTVMDVPTGVQQREVFDEHRAKGWLRVVGLAPEGAYTVGKTGLFDGRGKAVEVADLAPWLGQSPSSIDEVQVGPPAASAKVAVWRDFAVAQGADPVQVEGMTKAQLIAEFGDTDEGEDD